VLQERLQDRQDVERAGAEDVEEDGVKVGRDLALLREPALAVVAAVAITILVEQRDQDPVRLYERDDRVHALTLEKEYAVIATSDAY